jgi:aminomethyltransferase
LQRRRVGLLALERVPVREHTVLQSIEGQPVGEVSSGLLGPSIDEPIAMAYVDTALAVVGQRLNAIVRGKSVPMQVAAMPFVPNRYHRGPK